MRFNLGFGSGHFQSKLSLSYSIFGPISLSSKEKEVLEQKCPVRVNFNLWSHLSGQFCQVYLEYIAYNYVAFVELQTHILCGSYTNALPLELI